MEGLWCKFCEEYHLELKEEYRTATIKDTVVKYKGKYYTCPEFGDYETGELHDENMKSAKEEFYKIEELYDKNLCVDCWYCDIEDAWRLGYSLCTKYGTKVYGKEHSMGCFKE